MLSADKLVHGYELVEYLVQFASVQSRQIVDIGRPVIWPTEPRRWTEQTGTAQCPCVATGESEL